MLTIHELLEDKLYKQWFLTPPVMPTVYRQLKIMPWRVYIQREADGPWAKKDVAKYGEAFEVFKRWRPKIHDAAIVSRAVAFSPPERFVRIKGKYVVGSDGVKRQATTLVVWRPKVPAEESSHQWCPYCRRPTIFKYFSRHHAFTKADDPNMAALRCTICGIRLEGLPRMKGVR